MKKKILSREEVKHVARLAKLALTETELDRFRKQLSSILTYVSQLSPVPTQNVDPTAQTTNLLNVYRPDTSDPSALLAHPKAVANAPRQKDGFVRVERIL